MEDKEVQIPEGQEVTPQQEQETPEVAANNESPTEEVDKDFSEWATNKGYSEDDLKDEKLSKALNMARNAEKFAGKAKSQPQEESDDDVDIDKYLDELLGDNATPEKNQRLADAASDVDFSQLKPEEQALLKRIEDNAARRAEEKLAPYISQMRKQEYRAKIDALAKEYGDDVIKRAPEILTKVASGSSLEDATIAVLAKDLIKSSRNKGIEQGKQQKAQEIVQKVEQQKKADNEVITDLNELPIAEHRDVLKRLQAQQKN